MSKTREGQKDLVDCLTTLKLVSDSEVGQHQVLATFDRTLETIMISFEWRWPLSFGSDKLDQKKTLFLSKLQILRELSYSSKLGRVFIRQKSARITFLQIFLTDAKVVFFLSGMICDKKLVVNKLFLNLWSALSSSGKLSCTLIIRFTVQMQPTW